MINSTLNLDYYFWKMVEGQGVPVNSGQISDLTKLETLKQYQIVFCLWLGLGTEVRRSWNFGKDEEQTS